MADGALGVHTAIVTGANHGIGAATALALGQRGCAVLCAFLRMDDPPDPGTPQAYRERRRHDAEPVAAQIRAAHPHDGQPITVCAEAGGSDDSWQRPALRTAARCLARQTGRMSAGCISKQAAGDTGRMVDDAARNRAIYHALKAADEVAAALQAHLIEEHGADPDRAAAQSPATNPLKLLRQARERLGEGLRAVEADNIAESDQISLRNR